MLLIELSASGQVCYQFSDAQNGQPPTTVATVMISAIPRSLTGAGAAAYGAGFTSASSLSSGGANLFYSPSNVVTITSGQTTYSYNYFSIGINYSQQFNETILQINGSQYPPSGGNTFALTLSATNQNIGSLFPNGLTATLPPVISSAGIGFDTTSLFFGPPSGVAFFAVIQSIGSTCADKVVSIGGQLATVSFSGLVPGAVGLYQVDAQVPPNVAPGVAVPVALTIGGQNSNTVTIAVSNP